LVSSVKQLADYNNLNTNSGLFVGQKLNLKETAEMRAKAAEQKAAETKVTTQSYTVKRGEYLKLIADRHGLSNAELAALTPGLTAGSSLLVGQRINVPVSDSKAEAKTETAAESRRAAPSTSTAEIKTENYTVKRGDTLSSVAVQSKMSLADLAALNQISTNTGLRIGQTLKIPAGSTIPDSYTVQSGDTLTAIANRYNLSLEQIASLNGISRTAGLRTGQRLKLSGEPVSVEESKASTTAANSDIHIVKSGETLNSIARKYHLQLNYLAALNDLPRTAALRIGQRLKIEGDLDSSSNRAAESAAVSSASTGKATEAYTVKAGESLNAIASRTGISVAELAALNGLSPRAGLRVGQTLQLPKTIMEYKVKRGDTLIGLASRYGLETSELADMNEIKPNTQLRIGEIIKVPNL